MQGRAWCCLFRELTQISTMSSISSIDTALTDGAGELASVSLILLLVDSAGKFKVSQVPAEVSGTILTHDLDMERCQWNPLCYWLPLF
jgi:hypothetical protein